MPAPLAGSPIPTVPLRNPPQEGPLMGGMPMAKPHGFSAQPVNKPVADRLMPVPNASDGATKPLPAPGFQNTSVGQPLPIGSPMPKPTPTEPPSFPGTGNSPMPMQPTGRAPSATSPYAPPPPAGTGSGGIGPQSLAGFDQFADAAYEAATRRLDPQFSQRQDRFSQDMINRGLAPGTEAYNEAWQSFSMDRNDAYGQARNQALAQALAAQGQAFGQDFQNRNLSQQDRQFSDSLGFQYAGLNEQNRQFDGTMNFNNQRADMQDLMALLGYGTSVNQINNNTLNSDFNRASGLFGLFPGMQPTQVDVMNPYQMQQNAWAQQANMANQNANGMWGAIGQLGSAFMTSDRRLKTDVERVGTLDNGLPVYLARYITGGPRMLMLMAQDVLEQTPEAVADMGGFLAVDYARATA